MANLQGSSSTSTQQSNANAQSLTLSPEHGGQGLSFTVKDNQTEPVTQLYDLLGDVRELLKAANVPQRKNLVGQEAVQEAESEFITTLLAEYDDLKDQLIEALAEAEGVDQGVIREDFLSDSE